MKKMVETFPPRSIAKDYPRGAKRLRAFHSSDALDGTPSILFFMKWGGRVSREGLADSGNEMSGAERVPLRRSGGTIRRRGQQYDIKI